MKLLDIVSQYSWKKIESRYLELYPDEKSHKQEAREAFKYIKSINQVSSRMRIEIAYREDEDGSYNDVIGTDGTLRADGSEERFCIALVDWEEWLGMDIDPTVQKNYLNLDILCHCLWEMTWFGYSMEKIIQFREDLDCQAEEYSENIIIDEDWLKALGGT